jgi:hypothetical protein
MPYMQAGTNALGGYQDLVGLSGNDPQAAAIAALKGSPGFTSLYDTGADTILQNATATGGLRGGNANMSLANFGSGLLGQLIQQQLGNYSGLIQGGAQATGNIGQLGAQNSQQASNNLIQQGQTQANGTIGANLTFMNGLSGALNGLGSSGAFGGNMFGGQTSGGGGLFSLGNLGQMPTGTPGYGGPISPPVNRGW